MPALPPLPDTQPVTANALRNKRAEIAGDIEMHNREIDRLRAELVHVDAVLRLFDPGVEPDDIASRKRYPRRTDYFARGEITRAIFEALRDQETVAAGELAAVAMAAKGIAETDGAIRRDFVSRFLTALHDMRRRGSIAKVGHGRGVRWRLAPKEPDLI